MQNYCYFFRSFTPNTAIPRHMSLFAVILAIRESTLYLQHSKQAWFTTERIYLQHCKQASFTPLNAYDLHR